MPCVSVIIPTYNRAHLIPKAIDSVLSQTYQDFEIIVVDDGSEDQTVETVQSYGAKVKLIKQDNQGLNVARNRAVAEAKGEYIALLDDDDLWLDYKLGLQVGIMDRFPELGFLFSDFIIFKESGEKVNAGLRTWHSSQEPWSEIYDSVIELSSLDLISGSGISDSRLFIGNIYYELLFGPYVLPSTAIVRKSYMNDRIKFIDEDIHCGDWEFFARLTRLYPTGFIDIETTLNRSHDDKVRLTRKSRRVQTECRLGMIDRVWKSDTSFYETYRGKVDEVEGKQLVNLLKYQLLESDIRGAKESCRRLKKYKLKDAQYNIIILKMFVYLPGGHKIILFIRNLRRALHIIKNGLVRNE